MTPGSPWFKEVAARSVLDVARILGLTVSEHPLAFGPCPACGAERRHPSRHDRRPACGIRGGWRCYQCGASGDSLGLVARQRLGRAPEPDDFRLYPRKGEALRFDLWRACAVLGLCDVPPGEPAPKAARLPPPPPPAPPAPPRRPLAAEVAALWGACRPVLDDREVAGWLQGRSLDAGDVELWDLARALPRGLALPRWARFKGAAWNEAPQSFRCILPMYGASGALESLHARALHPQAANGSDKCAAPAGAELRGLVLANPLARGWLAGDLAATELVANVGLVIAEGDPDYLTFATHWSDAREDAPAVLGIVSGAWTPEFAEKVPSGCRVTVATHADEAGDRYADHIVESLKGHAVALCRWRAAA